MTVGNQANQATINNILSNSATQMRNLMWQIATQQEFIVSLGLEGLEAMGFGSADAQSAMTLMSYMNTIAGCYYGTVQQGGSGGTGAIEFDFDNALSLLWAGQ